MLFSIKSQFVNVKYGSSGKMKLKRKDKINHHTKKGQKAQRFLKNTFPALALLSLLWNQQIICVTTLGQKSATQSKSVLIKDLYCTYNEKYIHSTGLILGLCISIFRYLNFLKYLLTYQAWLTKVQLVPVQYFLINNKAKLKWWQILTSN